MSERDPIPLYKMFPALENNGKLTSDFDKALVSNVTVNETKRSMALTLTLAQPAPPFEIDLIEEMLACEFDLDRVSVSATYARPPKPDKTRKSKNGADLPSGTVIMGKKSKATPMPVGEVTLEHGNVTVKGVVCDISNKKNEETGALILSFDLTDYTGAIRVSKYMRKEESSSNIADSITIGATLTVTGKVGFNKYYGDLALEPSNITTAERAIRTDTADEKRVELHLHTRMSALDAVTDTKAAIRRAVEWGHPAIALTDHGVVQSFPDAAKASAADENIKVIYGLEGYFINDVESSTAVFGGRGAPEDEFVVFDVETTGLSPARDSIIEIGAVKIDNEGRELGKFHTFVDPCAPIPYEITKLTGITDEDTAGAPLPQDAVEAFLGFAGRRVMVAHNASFDVGFIYEACAKHGIDYTPSYIDTLAISRKALPKLQNHRLETVAAYFGAADFAHHRADADATVTARIFTGLMDLLRKNGVSDTGQINNWLLEKLYETGAKSGASKRRYRNKHIILLAKNETGLRNLYKLVSKSHLEDFDRYPIIYKSELLKRREGLIIGSACQAGEVFDAISERRGFLEQMQLAEFYDYLEIQPVCNNMFMIYSDKPRAGSEEDLRGFNRRVVELGKALGKPVVATGDVHFLDPEHEIFRHILLNSKNFDSADDNLPIYFKTTDEMLNEFSYLGAETAFDVVVRNSRAIADSCGRISPLPPPKRLFLPKLEGSAENLRKLVSAKLAELYGENPPENVSKRVEAELHDIMDRNYDVIYMAAQKLVSDSEKSGYIVGSRGSVGSSIVAFLAGITEVNSLPAHYRCPECKASDFTYGDKYGCGADMPDMDCPSCGAKYAKDGFNIPFETFLGFDGDKVPDIDLNFSGEYKAEAHKLASDLFGADHVFRAGTIGTVQDKIAYIYVKKYADANGKVLSKAEENRLIKGCLDVKQTTGQHPGGLIVIPEDMDVTDFCPIQHPSDDSDKGVVTTHFEYHCMEDNLIKLDILGHDDPTMLRMLQDMTGVDIKGIKLDDPDTLAIFSSPLPLGLPENDKVIGASGTIGISEFGTKLSRDMLRETNPGDFDTLVRLAGYAHGVNVWLNNARDLILDSKVPVSGTISCRDDIMLFLISRGMDDRSAFRISESVRKGYGLPDGAEDRMRGMGVPDWYISSCKKITYLFPKAHAAAYVIMAFRIAWFKVHRPLEYYSAYFYRRSQKDHFDAESMTRGIDVARAKINEINKNPNAKQKDKTLLTTLEACYEFYMRGFGFLDIDLYESDPVKFLIAGDGKLRPPLIAVSGLGDAVARDIAANRVGREFISVDEISAACAKVSKTQLEQLKALGALRYLPDSSQMSLF